MFNFSLLKFYYLRHQRALVQMALHPLVSSQGGGWAYGFKTHQVLFNLQVKKIVLDNWWFLNVWNILNQLLNIENFVEDLN